MSAILLQKRRTTQPPRSALLDLTFPAFAGVNAAIVTTAGDDGRFGNAAVPQLGELISFPIHNGTIAAGNTDVGKALVFDGSSTYLDYGSGNIPYSEFTLFFGGIFRTFTNFGGLLDCTDNGVSGWNIFQIAGPTSTDPGTLWYSITGYGGALSSSDWPTGQTVHGALRNKPGATCDWFRNGAKLTSLAGVTPIVPTLPLLVGRQRGGGIQYLDGSISYFYLLDKFVDDETIARIAVNPYIVFAPQRYIFQIAEPAAGGTLTGANCAEAGISSTGAITQGHILTASNCTESSASSTGAVSQGHILTGANCTEASTSGTGAIAGAGVLVGANCVEASTSSTGAVTQNHILAGANCTEAAASSTGEVASNAIILIGASCVEANFCDSGIISQIINTNWVLDSAISSGWVKDSSTMNTWS